jgi:hypothetical protein
MRKMGRIAIPAAAIAAATLLFAADAQAANIRARARRQQIRIAQGVRSGALTPRETAQLERREAALDREVHVLRADGGLTPRERARVNRQQNRLSRDIYRQKHDRQRRRY